MNVQSIKDRQCVHRLQRTRFLRRGVVLLGGLEFYRRLRTQDAVAYGVLRNDQVSLDEV